MFRLLRFAVPLPLLALFLLGCAAGPPPAPEPLVQAGPDAAAQSFARRCAMPGVVRCVAFDRPDEIPDLSPSTVGSRGGRGPMGRIKNNAGDLLPELDCSTAVNGCAMKFVVPSRSGAGTSGAWFANFSDDFSVRFGEGEEFYVQWRQRFSPDFLNAYQSGIGWKQIIIGEGDRPNYAPSGKVVWSCTQLEVVIQNTYFRGYPRMHHSCGGKDGRYDELPVDSAADYEPDQWMTFQVRVKIGTWYKNDRDYRYDSVLELWVGREGERSRRAIVIEDYDLANNDPDAKYGKLWLLTYNTGKDSGVEHPPGETWYDELIISRAPIPDP
jgi:hypothetical protein